MAKESQNQLYSFLYLFALYLGVKLLPLQDWIPYTWLVYVAKIVLVLAIIGLQIYEINRGKMAVKKPEHHLPYLVLVPLILGCLSNFLYCWCFQVEATVSIEPLEFILKSFVTLGEVVIEELLFRYIFLIFIYGLLKESKTKNFLCILFSSLAFGAMHLINFFGNNPLVVLSQIGYTVVLGLILGFIALYFESPILPCIGHFLFNFLNTNLYVVFYSAGMTDMYILFSVGIAALVFCYLILLYYIDRKNKHVTS